MFTSGNFQSDRLAASRVKYITIAGSGSLDLVRGLVDPGRIVTYPSSDLPLILSMVQIGEGVFPLTSNAARVPLFRLHPAVCKILLLLSMLLVLFRLSLTLFMFLFLVSELHKLDPRQGLCEQRRLRTIQSPDLSPKTVCLLVKNELRDHQTTRARVG